MTDPDAEIAKRVAQVAHLEERLWAAREAAARAQRHRGELTGLLRAALADDAIGLTYRALAERTLDRIRSESDPRPNASGSPR